MGRPENAVASEKTAYKPPPPPRVTVGTPVRQEVTDHLELTGNSQAVNTVQLRARVQGYLEKVFFQYGQVVKKGQPLFQIERDTYVAKLKQAEGQILTQEARLEHAKTEFARFSSLVRQKAAAQTDVDQWRDARDSAEGALPEAKAARDLARLDLNYALVTAPFGGRIDRRLVDPGNLVGAGENTILAQMSQLDPIYVYFTVNDLDLRTEKVGTKLTVLEPAAEAKTKIGVSGKWIKVRATKGKSGSFALWFKVARLGTLSYQKPRPSMNCWNHTKLPTPPSVSRKSCSPPAISAGHSSPRRGRRRGTSTFCGRHFQKR